MRVIIDRLEEEFAVVELDGRMYNVPRALLPGAQEGDTAEITVLGKIQSEGGDAPHEIFERLRKKSRRKKKDKSAKTIEKAEDRTVSESAAEAAVDVTEK